MRRVLTSKGEYHEQSWTLRATGATERQAGDLLRLDDFIALPAGERAQFGVWLRPDEAVETLGADAAGVQRIAVEFPTYRDGRGYSTAALLRTRYGFAGDLRAVGDVLIDQVFYLKRVGFSSFALREDQDEATAKAALGTFSDTYQRSSDQPLPAFRRHAA